MQFSAPVCAPCRAARRVLADVAARLDGVVVREVGVDEHLDAARELDVWRTRRCWWWTRPAAWCAGPRACPTATT
nr:thioredoxin family protein [Micromonospora provocatoris]